VSFTRASNRRAAVSFKPAWFTNSMSSLTKILHGQKKNGTTFQANLVFLKCSQNVQVNVHACVCVCVSSMHNNNNNNASCHLHRGVLIGVLVGWYALLFKVEYVCLQLNESTVSVKGVCVSV